MSENQNAELILAVQEGDLARAEALLEEGANPNARDESGEWNPFLGTTALFWATSQPKMTRLLIEHGASVEAEEPDDGHGAVHRAAEDGNLEVLQLLMQAGGQCALNHFDYISRTPLMCAIDGGHIDCARFLIEQGSDVNAHNDDRIGDTAIRRAVEEGQVDIVEMLLEAGADPSIPGWMQLTAVHKAVDRRDDIGQRILALFGQYGN